jgi:hypothetical protein
VSGNLDFWLKCEEIKGLPTQTGSGIELFSTWYATLCIYGVIDGLMDDRNEEELKMDEETKREFRKMIKSGIIDTSLLASAQNQGKYCV